MGKINQPYDLLEDTQFLKTVLQDNIALQHNDYRPLQEFDTVMRQFARDFLRNYLFKKYASAKSHMDVEDEIREFERETYGTENNSENKDK